MIEKEMAKTQERPQEEQEKIDHEARAKEAIEVMGNLIRAAQKFKSVRRAMRRGHVTSFGMIVARKPFNNRANTSTRKGVHSRFVNLIKKRDYEAAKSAAARESL